MALDISRDDLVIGVVGAGAMGRGIAQVAAVGGCRVLLFDSYAETVVQAVDFIKGMLERAAEKGRMEADEADAAMDRIQAVGSLSAMSDAHVVIEAVIEDLDIKHRVFKELESTVGKDTILASNTSSLSVASIAAACDHPERVAGMHFFNPVPLMKLVEVIAGARTAPWVTDALFDLGRRMGRDPIHVADSPGFVVNQVGRGYTVEAAHIAHEGVASFNDMDRIMREAAGFRMGPFELMDLTGLDVTQPASELIYEQSFHEPRYRPTVLMKLRQTAGLLGRKSSGRGFYAYGTDGKQVPEDPAPPAYDGHPVWICGHEASNAADLHELLRSEGIEPDLGSDPPEDALLLVAPLGKDATTTALDEGLDPTRVVAVDSLFGLKGRRTLMTTVVTRPDMAAAAHGLMARDGTPVTMIKDSPGFVAQRIIAMIVNIGCAVAQAGTASPADIDKAVTLGLGYPHGPLSFGDAIGPDKILRILRNIHAFTGDPRYRPTPWLIRRARLGVSLLTPAN